MFFLTLGLHTCGSAPVNHQGAEETNTTSEKMPEVVQEGSKQVEVKEKPRPKSMHELRKTLH